MTRDPRSLWEVQADELYQRHEEEGTFDLYDKIMTELEEDAKYDPDVRAALDDWEEEMGSPSNQHKKY